MLTNEGKDAPRGATRGGILVDYARLAISLDLNPTEMMLRSGLDLCCLDDPDVLIPFVPLADLLEITARHSGLDDFGLRLAEASGLPNLGPLLLIMNEASTLRTAARALVSFIHLHSDAVYLQLEESDETVLGYEIITAGAGECRQVTDCGIGRVVRLLRWLIGAHWSPASIAFTHSPPSSTSRYDRFFRCPIDFHSQSNGIYFRPLDLDAVLLTSPTQPRQVERYIRNLNAGSSAAYLRQVSQNIAIALPRREASTDIVAQRLGCTKRTLHRRLAREKEDFSSLLQKTRERLTTQYIMNSQRALSDIASSVGFDSLSAFSSWFHRSFGCTASAWRKSQRTKSDTLPDDPSPQSSPPVDKPGL